VHVRGNGATEQQPRDAEGCEKQEDCTEQGSKNQIYSVMRAAEKLMRLFEPRGTEENTSYYDGAKHTSK
jgi:hypothetical protein